MSWAWTISILFDYTWRLSCEDCWGTTLALSYTLKWLRAEVFPVDTINFVELCYPFEEYWDIDQRDWSAYYVCVQLLDWRVVRSIPAITYNARLESFPCSICSQSFSLSSLMTVSKTTENLDSSAYTLSMLDKETFCLSPLIKSIDLFFLGP